MNGKIHVGERLHSKWKLVLVITIVLLFVSIVAARGNENTPATYVGSLACKDCHPEEYENFMTYAKKSISFQSIEKQMKHLTTEEIKKC